MEAQRGGAGLRRLGPLAAAVGLLVAATGMAGCGDDKSHDKPKGPPLTKAQYIAAMTDITRDVRGKRPVPKRAPRLVQTTAFVQKLGVGLAEFSHRMRELNPPPAVRRPHAMLAAAFAKLASYCPPVLRELRVGRLAEATRRLRAIRFSAAARQAARAQRLYVSRGYHFLHLPGIGTP